MGSRPFVHFAILALVGAVLAGCINSDPGVPNPDDADDLAYYLVDEFPVDLDHNHAEATLHNASLNIHFEGYSSCTSDGQLASAVGGFTDIAFHRNHAFIGNSRGFCVLDVADPLQPKFLAQYEGESASDMEVSADGNYAFLLTQRNGVPGPLQRGEDDPKANLPRGVIIVNVNDKSNPVYESWYPIPTNGVHTATAYLMGTRQLLFVQTYDWVPPGGVNVPVPQQNPPVTQRVEIFEMIDLQGVKVLQLLSRYSLDRPPTEQLAMWFPHDSYIQFHPSLRKTLMYIAYWDAGLVILDVSNPESPTFVSRYGDKEPSIYNQYHDVKVFEELIDGRHITVTGPEIPSGPESGMIRIFDTTDPTKPVQLGTWRLPGNPGVSGFNFSPHVFTLNEGRIYLGHNHGGVWVLDVHNETLLKQPGTAGFYFPRGDESTQTWSRSASTWGAYFHDGHTYATESSGGVHVLHFALDHPPEDVLAMPA